MILVEHWDGVPFTVHLTEDQTEAHERAMCEARALWCADVWSDDD